MPHPNAYRARVEEFPGRIFGRISESEQISACREIISRSPEVFVELGSGSGLHLIEQSRRHPSAALFGFELRFKRAVRTVEKAERAGIKNLFILRCHTQLLRELFPDGSLSGVWVNFPDPWDKRKKHRMLNSRSLADIHALLKPGAALSFKTDHREYFEAVAGQLVNDALLVLEELIAGSPDAGELPGDNVTTEFESLFRSQGLPVYFLRARKPALKAGENEDQTRRVDPQGKDG